MARHIEKSRKEFATVQPQSRGGRGLRASLLGLASTWYVAVGMMAMPAVAIAAKADPLAAKMPETESAQTVDDSRKPEEVQSIVDKPINDETPALPQFAHAPARLNMFSSNLFSGSLSGGTIAPMSIVQPPPATNDTLPGHVSYLNNWLLGNDYQACGAGGTGCLTIDRANFNYSYLSLILNLAQAPNAIDLDGNQPANHLTLIGSVRSDSYIQFQDSNYFGNNNNASCVIIGLACTWRTNPAQNNQVLIGDGSYANGSNTVVMGTNARHQLPTVTAASAGFIGGPDTNYAARLGNSVVIGDNSFGNANRQTILGFGATSTHANSIALGAGSATVVGAQTGYVAFGLTSPQTSAGELSIGSAGATRKLTNVAAGSVGTDAVNLAQLQGALSTAAADPFAVKYNDLGGSPDFANLTLQGPAGTTISNLSAGAIGAASTQAVNGAQIYAISQSSATRLGGGATVAPDGTITAPNYVIGGTGYDNVGAALAALDSGSAGGNAFSVLYADDGTGNPDYSRIALRGPVGIGTVLGNVAGGQVAAGSLEATNGGQLHAVGANAASIFGGGASFNAGAFGAPSYLIQGSSHTNVGAALGAVDGTLSDLYSRIAAIPGGPGGTSDPRVALDGAGNASVTAGTGAVAIGAGADAGGDHGTAIGSDSHAAGDNDTAIGGNARVNADGSTAVGANSSIAASATNAVAIGESASATASGAVALGQGAVADRANTVSVGTTAAQRQIANVAAGTQDNDAVNVAQLKASEAGAIRYDSNADGSVNRTQMTLNNGGAAVQVRNVRAGVAATDAVNVQQLNDGVNRAISTSNQYTDNWGNSLRQEIGQLDDQANAGVASAMAVAGLPQSYMPGKSMAAVAASSFQGETGFAIGVSTITDDGRWVHKLSGNSNSKGDIGVTIGTGLMW